MPIYNPLHPAQIVKDMIKVGGIKISKYPSVFMSVFNFIYRRSGITPSIAQKLTVIFPSTDEEFWLNLQRDYNISKLNEAIE